MSKDNYYIRQEDRSVESEVLVLSRIAMYKDQAFLSSVDPQWFMEPLHREILKAWIDHPKTLDSLELINHFSSRNIPTNRIAAIYTCSFQDDYGFFISSMDLQNKHFTALKIVKDKWLQRKVHSDLGKYQDVVYYSNIDNFCGDLANYFYGLKPSSQTIKKVTGDKTQVEVISFNDRDLDDLLPIRKSLWIIAGDSGHHKSNYAIHILYKALKANKDDPSFKVCYFSKEMDYDEVKSRLIAKVFNVDLKALLKGEVDLIEIDEKLKNEYRWLQDRFIIIPDEDIQDVSDLNKYLLALQPAVWCLDFLQLFADTGPEKDTNARVSQLTTTTKKLCKITNSLGILLSQLRKFDQQRLTHMPRVDDIEWAGRTKHLAHNIGMCFWPFKVESTTRKDVHIVSWLKVRNGDMRSTIQFVDPPFCDFRPMEQAAQKGFQPYLKL